jgi:3-oxoacyl-[acyl-carrier protein] reductase
VSSDAAVGVVVPGLQGTTVAVTGAASGIGRATSLLVARSGAHVVAGDMNDPGLADLEKTAAADGLSVKPVRLDVSDPASVKEFIALAAGNERFWGAVCAAGISPDMDLLDMTLEGWNRVLGVNLTGTFLVAQEAARVLVERGQGGSIVTVASNAATTGTPGLGHYNASKAGVMSLTKTLARELGVHEIRANCISPGAVNTPLFWSRMDSEQAEQWKPRSPLTRIGEPEDLAKAIGFLLSDLSPWITGQVINVNGGSLMP